MKPKKTFEQLAEEAKSRIREISQEALTEKLQEFKKQLGFD